MSILKAIVGNGINAHIKKDRMIYLFLKAYLFKTIIVRKESAGIK